MGKLKLSARAYGRISIASQTIADFHNTKDINSDYITELIQKRGLNIEGWLG